MGKAVARAENVVSRKGKSLAKAGPVKRMRVTEREDTSDKNAVDAFTIFGENGGGNSEIIVQKNNSKVVEIADNPPNEVLQSKSGVLDENDPESVFATAFSKIMHRRIPSEVPGPILAGKRSLLLDKLMEEESLKEKHKESRQKKAEEREKNHTKPTMFLDSHERNLIKIATKGIVRLFNAVSKAQKDRLEGAQPGKGKKSTGAALIAELSGNDAIAASKKGATLSASNHTGAKASPSSAWSVLQDKFDVGKMSMKNWDTKDEEQIEDAEEVDIDSQDENEEFDDEMEDEFEDE